MKRKVITPEFRHVEIDTSSSARIVQLAKTKAITHPFDLLDSPLGPPFNVTQRRAWKIKRTPDYKTKNHDELKRCETSSS